MSRPTNTVILIGRLTKDIIVNYVGENQTAMTKFSLAVDRGRRNADGQSESDFPSCTAFGKTAEFIEKYFSKGSKIAVEGELRTGSYTNKDGQTVYTTDVNVDKVDFVESRQSAQNGREGGHGSQPNNYTPRQGNGNYGNSDRFKKQSSRGDIGNGFVDIPADVEAEGLPWN